MGVLGPEAQEERKEIKKVARQDKNIKEGDWKWKGRSDKNGMEWCITISIN